MDAQLVGILIGGVLGSRVAYVIEHWSAEFAAHPADVVKVWQGGPCSLLFFVIHFPVFCSGYTDGSFSIFSPISLIILCATIPFSQC